MISIFPVIILLSFVVFHSIFEPFIIQSYAEKSAKDLSYSFSFLN